MEQIKSVKKAHSAPVVKIPPGGQKPSGNLATRDAEQLADELVSYHGVLLAKCFAYAMKRPNTLWIEMIWLVLFDLFAIEEGSHSLHSGKLLKGTRY